MRVLVITVADALIASVELASVGDVEVAGGLADGLSLLGREDFAVVLLDANLPGLDVADACSRLRDVPNRAAPSIVLALDDSRAEALIDDVGHVVDDVHVGAVGPQVLRARLRLAERAFVDRETRKTVDRRLARLVESDVVGIAASDLQGTFDEANDAFLRLIGYSRQELGAGEVTRARVMPPDEGAGARDDASGLQEKILVAKDGATVPLVVGAALVQVANALGFIADLSQRKAVELELREVTAFLDSVVERIPLMVFVKDAKDLRFERFNRAGEQLLGMGREQLLGKTDYDLFPKEQADFFQKKDRETLGRRTEIDVSEEPIRTPRGERWLHTHKVPILDEHGEPRHLLGISEDITERRDLARALDAAHDELERRVRERTAELAAANAELRREVEQRERAQAALEQSREQLMQAQKLEAVGQLARGIAHDFNNLLSIILSYTTLDLRRLSPGDPMRDDLEEIRSAGKRAATLTHQLLAFSRQQVLQPRPLDLNQILAGMGDTLRHVVGEAIELKWAPAPALGVTTVDPGNLEQVVLNLVMNARDAMPEGGRLTLETANVDLDEAFAAAHPGVTAGPHVRLSVTDTGVGMDAATQARIFEPFFTTKEHGKGTGLGLSTAFGIMKQSGGSIWLDSEPGKGASFVLYFPRTEDAAVPEAMTVQGSAAAPRGSETVLVVEDELRVRAVACEILKGQGYHVVEADSGTSALAFCEHDKEAIDLLVTDVAMPRMSGPQLAERLRTVRPDLRVLYMSGYTDDAIAHQGILDAGIAFLQKPFTPDSLARKVRSVLDGHA